MSLDEERLAALRAQIDDLNFEILDLLSRRVKAALEVGKCKAKLGISGFDPVREAGMIKRLCAANSSPFSDEAVTAIFKFIFQKTLEVMDEQDRGSLKVSRASHCENTIININGCGIGSGQFCVIAGPCSAEDEEQVEASAAFLEKIGVKIMRGGAFKPRTSPYDFQGLGLEGLKMLWQAAKRHNLSLVSEVTDPRMVEEAYPYLDVIQIGARNMYNYDLLKEIGRQDKPVILKRHFSASLEELLLSAEYIINSGNPNVILCERGIRTYERWVRSTLDISAVPLLKQQSHLPVMADISHAAGRRDILPALAKAAKACGADALMVEVHPCPVQARSDSRQQLDFEEFAELFSDLKDMH